MAALGLAIVYTGLPMDSLPFASKKGNEVTWFGIGAKSSYLGYWINYNFKGYEGKEAYPEYAHLMDELGRVGREYGCGRSLWEYDAARTESYGTTLSMMLIPYWTGGCIAVRRRSVLRVVAVDAVPLPHGKRSRQGPVTAGGGPKDYWRDLDLNRAVEHMRTLGVNYYIADSAEAVVAAKAHPDLTLVGKAGVWSIFQIANTDLVVPLDYEPYVETGVDATAKDWLRTGLATWDPVGDRRLRGGRRPTVVGPHQDRRQPPGFQEARSGRGQCRHHRNRSGVVPRRQGRSPRTRAYVVLPGVEGQGCQGPVSGDTEPHGGRADGERRDTEVRPNRHRLDRHRIDPARRRRIGRHRSP